MLPPFPRLFLLLASFLLVGAEVASAADSGEPIVIRAPSPDGEFAVRFTYPPGAVTEPRGVPRRIELIRAATKETVLPFDLQDEKDDLDFELLWSPDSRRFATRLAIERITALAVYQRAGDSWEKCALPDFTTYHPALKEGYEEWKFLAGGEKPVRWEKTDLLLMEGLHHVLVSTTTAVEGKFRLRLRFATDGKGAIEKVVSRKVSGPAR